MTKVSELKVGDVIMPPKREVLLWMRRAMVERKLSESALYLTVTEVRDGTPDKAGPWTRIITIHTTEWCSNYINPDPRHSKFSFKARPFSPWVRIQTTSQALPGA